MTWNDDAFHCDAKWLRVHGDLDSVSKNCGLLTVNQSRFLGEWKFFLDKIYDFVERSGVSVQDATLLTELTTLLNTLSLQPCSPPYLYNI